MKILGTEYRIDFSTDSIYERSGNDFVFYTSTLRAGITSRMTEKTIAKKIKLYIAQED